MKWLLYIALIALSPIVSVDKFEFSQLVFGQSLAPIAPSPKKISPRFFLAKLNSQSLSLLLPLGLAWFWMWRKQKLHSIKLGEEIDQNARLTSNRKRHTEENTL